jgi:hypothetical protein
VRCGGVVLQNELSVLQSEISVLQNELRAAMGGVAGADLGAAVLQNELDCDAMCRVGAAALGFRAWAFLSAKLVAASVRVRARVLQAVLQNELVRPERGGVPGDWLGCAVFEMVIVDDVSMDGNARRHPA